MYGGILEIVTRGDVGVGDVHIVVGVDDHGCMLTTDLIQPGHDPTSTGVREIFHVFVAAIGTGSGAVAADVDVVVGIDGHAQPRCVAVLGDERRGPTSAVSDRHVDVVFAVVMAVHDHHFVLRIEGDDGVFPVIAAGVNRFVGPHSGFIRVVPQVAAAAVTVHRDVQGIVTCDGQRCIFSIVSCRVGDGRAHETAGHVGGVIEQPHAASLHGMDDVDVPSAVEDQTCAHPVVVRIGGRLIQRGKAPCPGRGGVGGITKSGVVTVDVGDVQGTVFVNFHGRLVARPRGGIDVLRAP